MPTTSRRAPKPAVTLDDLHTHLRHLTKRVHEIHLIVAHLARTDRAQGVTDMAVMKDVQDRLATLQSSVEGETDLVQAVKTLQDGQTALLIDLRAQLAAAIAGNDPVALQAVVDTLDTITATNTKNAEEIAASVVKNTPAATARKAK
jgi:hypothetical protein